MPDPNEQTPPPDSATEPFPKDLGIRFMLAFGLLIQMAMMAVGLWPAIWLVMYFGPAASTPWHWTLIILAAVLAFNYGWLLALLLQRIITPYPKEGTYLVVGRRPPKQAVIYMLNVWLLKSRIEPPWAAMFSAVLTRIFPLRPLFNRLFGPRTCTTTPGDSYYCFDPHLIEIGENVQLGFQCILSAHVFDNRKLTVRRTVIGDNVLIGVRALIMPGVRIGDHAIIGAHAVVRQDTVIAPYEIWAGVPAKKIGTRQAAEQDASELPNETHSELPHTSPPDRRR